MNEMNKRLEEELKKIGFEEIAGKNKSCNDVSLDLDLYDGRNTSFGYADVIWHSSKPHIISPSGFVMGSEKPEKVTLTAEFSFQGHPELKGIRSFEITAVPGALKTDYKISNAPIRIFIAGDSTACSYPHNGDSNRYPQTGWGQVLGELFTDTVGIVNCARSGRSSKSFLHEENYIRIKDNMRNGDYLFIQFAHNDSKAEDEKRYTSPFDGSFAKCINIYIDTAKNAGAEPVLCTPLTRNIIDDTTLVPYSDEMRRISAEQHIDLLDIYNITNSLLKKEGECGRIWMYMHLKPQDNRFTGYKDYYRSQYYNTELHDNTHLNINGARAVAKIVADELRRINHPLARYLK